MRYEPKRNPFNEILRLRIKELARECRRKDKALAETAALLVPSKKLEAIFRDGEDA